MNILLFGRSGQVAWELQRSLAIIGKVTVVDRSHPSLCGDLANPAGIAQTIRILKPDVVVNAAAYTAVDAAEYEENFAALINTQSVAAMAKETSILGALLVHFSTDYVFDGSGTHFRDECEAPAPLNVYGQTKLQGEEAIVKYNPRHFIFRTSWVYANRGKNFLLTMLKLGHDKETLSVINDQFGAPTSASLIADCTAIAIREGRHSKEKYGTYHLVASGEVTWFDYASYIFSIAKQNRVTLNIKELNSIPCAAYPTPATRPLNSRISNKKIQEAFNIKIPDWRLDVERVVTEVVTAGI